MRRSAPCILLAALLPGCDTEPPDTDGDGLTDEEEEVLGTDPGSADTDGDGYDDGTEREGNTNPLDAGDHPYLGGWPIGACRNSIAGTGWAVGDVAQAFSLVDQFNETVDFHDLCGNFILIEVGASWCPPCQEAAPELQALYEAERGSGLLVVSMLAQDEDEQPATSEDAATWANQYGLTFPVLADPSFGVSGQFIPGDTISMPSYSFLDEDMRFVAVDEHFSSPQEVLSRVAELRSGG